MAKAPVLTPRKPASKPVEANQTTFLLPDGRLIEAGMIVRVIGSDDLFRFKYARRGDITCWGGPPKHEAWHSFRPDQIESVTANARVAAILTAVPDVDVAAMTPGQKAAHTKKLKAAAAAMAVAA